MPDLDTNLHVARRRLAMLHDELRGGGLNPIEALSWLADRLATLPELLQLDPTADVVSMVYQEFLVAEARNGLGQYLTPLPVADLLAQVLVAAQPSGRVLDPFCGSGLLLDRVAAHASGSVLMGVEVSRPVARLATALATVGKTTLDITHADAFRLWLDDELPRVDAVVANPPFGATVSSVDLANERIPESLRRLGQIPAELLGLEVCVSVLADDGFLGIVLPRSFLTNRTWAAYRRDVLDRLQVRAIVTLPDATFVPFRGVARSCVLIATRARPDARRKIAVFHAQGIGYDDTGRPSARNDVPHIASSICADAAPDEYVTVDEAGAISSEPGGSEATWRLGEMAEVFVGRNPGRSEYCKDGPRLLKVGDLSGQVTPWRDRKRNRVSRAWFEKNRRLALRSGDVCLTAAAHRPRYIGLKVDLVDAVPIEGAIPSGEVLVIRPKDDAPVTAELLLYWLRSASGYGCLQRLVRGSTGHLYPADVRELRIPAWLAEVDGDRLLKAHAESVAAFREYRRMEDEAFEAAVELFGPPNADVL